MANTRKTDQIIKNFTNSLTDHDLQFFASRLYYQYQDDLSSVFDRLGVMKKNNQLENADVDYWLSNAKTSAEFLKQVDILSTACLKEYERRGGARQNLI